MRLSKILFFSIVFFWVTQSFSQTHNTNCMRCRYSKSYIGNLTKEQLKGTALDECGCPVCEKKIREEKAAKTAEQNRRNEAIWAKAKAEQEQKQKAFEAKQQQKRDELAAANAKKEAEEKTYQDGLQKKKNKIAGQGEIKSNVQGKEIATNVDVDKIELFNDKGRREFGFKLDGVEVKTFPFDGYNNYITRLEKTNFFQVTVFNKHEKYDWDVYSHSYLINRSGQKLVIDGIDSFDKEIGVYDNMIYLTKWLNTPRFLEITDEYCYGNTSTATVLYESESAAEARLEDIKITYGGLAMCYKYKLVNVNQYKLDLNGKLLEKLTGYQLISFR